MPHPYLKEIKKIYAANANATIAKGAKAYLLNQLNSTESKRHLDEKFVKNFTKNILSKTMLN